MRRTLYGSALDPPLLRLTQGSTGPPLVCPQPLTLPKLLLNRNALHLARILATRETTQGRRPLTGQESRACPALPHTLFPPAGSAAHNPRRSRKSSASRRA